MKCSLRLNLGGSNKQSQCIKCNFLKTRYVIIQDKSGNEMLCRSNGSSALKTQQGSCPAAMKPGLWHKRTT